MKTKLLFTLATLFVSSLSMAQANFRCVNNMYRTSTLELSHSGLTIKDSHVAGSRELQALINENIGSGRISVSDVTLVVDRKDVNCTAGESFELDCTGATPRASLFVQGYISHSGGISGLVNLSIQAELKDLVLTSSNGQSVLGTKATAALVVNGKPLDLQWSTFFYPRAGSNGDGSFCNSL